MDRNGNIRIFEETLASMGRENTLKRALSESKKNQRLILENDAYKPSSGIIFDEDASVVVSSRRTLEAAGRYRGMKTAVLNFASAVQPGGGVLSGSSAQEEALCRCSTLYPNLKESYLWRKFYSPHRSRGDRRNNDDVIYTPGVVVFKSDDDSPSLLSESEWYFVNVVTCAAPDLREPRPGNSDWGKAKMNISKTELMELHIRRMRRIMEIASGEGNEVLVIGAFGCGAFANPPRIVAEAAGSVINEYRRRFRTIEAAVYCSPGRDENYRVFKSVLGGLGD